MTSGAITAAPLAVSPRHYLMCDPEHFEVSYAINPWMTAGATIDKALARAQWENLRNTYRRLGHRVEVITGEPGLPDMVFAANAGTMVAGRLLAARMAATERRGEQRPYRRWFGRHLDRVELPRSTNEGEGDFVWTGRVLLCGSGFRATPEAGAEAAQVLGVPVVALELVLPQYYHLDTALFVIDPETIAYYPAAFSEDSQRLLAELFPSAILADADDAACLGLNAVSDGRHVLIAPRATGLIGAVAARGLLPIPVDMSEFAKAGGGIKCCTLELRA